MEIHRPTPYVRKGIAVYLRRWGLIEIHPAIEVVEPVIPDYGIVAIGMQVNTDLIDVRYPIVLDRHGWGGSVLAPYAILAVRNIILLDQDA